MLLYCFKCTKKKKKVKTKTSQRQIKKEKWFYQNEQCMKIRNQDL